MIIQRCGKAPPVSGLGLAVNQKASLDIISALARPLSIANFAASDGDAGQWVSYYLSGADSWLFSINSNGVLMRKYDFDYEKVGTVRPNHQIWVMVSAYAPPGGGVRTWGGHISQLFILTINDVETSARELAKTFISGIALNENNAIGDSVGQFSSLDTNKTSPIYSLSGGDANYFTVDANGNLKLKSVLDYEDSNHTAHNYSVVVTKSTTGNPAVSQLFVLTLLNINEPTIFVTAPTGSALSENNTVGVVVGNFMATDGDGSAVTYSLGGTDAAYFTIDANGNLKLISVLDFEDVGHAAQNYTVVVTAKSGDASPAISQLFVLSLGNIDEATGFVATTRGGAISENNAVGVVVGNFLATDGDGAVVTYSFGGTDANYFTIDSNGNLKLKSVLDFEDAGHIVHNYTVVVTAKATDASPAISQVFVLSLGNVDEATSFVATTTGSAMSENNAVGVVVGNFLATDGDGAIITYDLSGDDANYFTIDSNGNLKLISVLDFEDTNHTAKNYSVVVTAKAADASPAISQLFILTLGNVDEATGFVATTTGADITENNAVDIIVGNFLATDGDGASVTYDLSGADANYFTIDATGNLKLKSVLDFEDTGHTAQNYTVVVTAKLTDASGAISQLFILTLGNVDEATSFIATTTGVAVNENNAVGIIVGNFLATDGDGAGVNYDLSGADANYFTIDSNGNLKLKSSLDFEDLNHTAHNYSVVVTAKSSDASPAISQLFVLSFGNVDEATSFVATTTGADITENNAVDIIVGNFLATDGDGAIITYDLSGDDATYFTIDSNGNLKLISVLDFENTGHTAKNYSVVVRAKSTDASGAISQLFILTLGNVDEATGFVATTTGVAVNENNAVGIIVGNFLATDGDGAGVNYDLSGADANYFTIDSNGNLKLKSSLDFEDLNHTAHNYSVVVTAKSSDASSAISQLFVLSLGDVDEATSFVAAPTSGADISENNAVGVVVANFLATDGDGAGVNYDLSGADATYFTIDATGNLKLKSVLDFEDVGHANHNYTVVVTAKSGDASPAISQLFVLSLGNVDEATSFVAAPTSGADISENNAVGVVVANFLATDGDGAGVNYDLSGADATYFTIDSNGDLKLISVLDYEDVGHTAQNYTVVVTAKSGDASPAISQLFVLSLGDVVEAAGFVAAPTGGVGVSENNTVGVVVGNFLATDSAAAAMTYSLGGTDANYFTIDANGNLKLKSSLDYEDVGRTVQNYTVVVTAKSSDVSPAISQLFILTLGNVDEATGFVATTTGVVVNENNAVGVVVGNFLATDSDGAGVNYDLSGDDATYFTIDSNGNLKLKSSLDYEDVGRTVQNYTVVVTAKSSDASPAISQVFILTLGNVDEATSFVATTTGGAVNENNAVGIIVGNFRATDGDGAGVNYDLSGADATYFTIDSNGNLKLTSVLDYEDVGRTVQNYTVVVTAKSSDASPAISQVFILTLGNVDEATSFVATTTGGAVNENNAVGIIVGNFLATDGDGAAVNYDLSGADANYFTIDSNGNLKLTSVLDYEDTGRTVQNYTVVVTAKSGDASGAISQVFILTLGNIDDPARFVTVTTGSAMSENNAVGVVVGNFLATDGDGAMVTYSLGGTDSAYFTIDANGNLKCKSKLDFKDMNHTANNYSVVVVAKSTDASPAISQLFVLSLGNIDKPANFVAITRGGTITENNAVGHAVANFRASDGDGVAVTYSLDGPDAGYFSIDTTAFFISGINYLKLKSSLNYEDVNHRDHKYSVVIIAKSTDASPPVSQLFVLTVGNIAEPTSFITAPPTRSGMSENNAVGVVVSNFMATDGDRVAVTYSLGGTDANYFTVDSAGNLKLKSVLDFEDSAHIAKNYTVVVMAKSIDASPAISQLFVLSLGNVDDPTTFVTAPTGSPIFENNEIGWAVGTFRATDGDAAAVTYSLSGADAAYFSINSNGKLSLKSSLNYEDPNHVAHNYSVMVVAKSVDASPAVSQLFVLSVANANEPTIFTVSRDGIKMLSYDYTPPRVVGIFSAIDDDGLAVTYGVSGTDAKFFNINAAGKLLLISTLNYDDPTHANHIYSVVVSARSLDGGSAISKLFILTLVDKIEIATPFDPQRADHTAYIDGTTAVHAVNVGGIIGHDDAGNIDYANVQFHGVNYTDKVITRNVDPDGLQSTTVDYVVRGISDLESLRISFNGFTDTDGSKRNHWFFVQDDATDHSGHIVFDADGQNVNLHALNNGGGLATSDQINLLAGSNYGIDGDFAKPTDLNLNLASDPLHQNIAGALTFDQFLALLGGNNHISFV